MANKLVENIDDDTWTKFAGFCKMKGLKVGEALNDIIKCYLDKELKR